MYIYYFEKVSFVGTDGKDVALFTYLESLKHNLVEE